MEPIYEAMGVAVLMTGAVVVMRWLGSQQAEPDVSVRAGVIVAMNAATVTMGQAVR